MVSATEPNQEKGWKAHLLVVAVVVASVLFILTSAAPAVQTAMAQPSTASNGYQPEPTMNSNITWSDFQNGWAPLEYNNGTANLTLNTEISSIYPNPFSINASDIQAAQFNQPIGGMYWNNTASYYETPPADGQVQHFYSSTINGEPAITYGINGTSQIAQEMHTGFQVLWSTLPSNNYQYDYFTIKGFITGTSAFGPHIVIINQTSPINAYYYREQITSVNESAAAVSPQTTLTTGQSFYYSIPLSAFANISNTKSQGVSVAIEYNTPIETTGPSCTTITGMALTTYPMSLGPTTLNKASIATAAVGNALTESFDPTYTWKDIAGSGYTVSTSQPMQNLNTEQTPITNGIYTEEATYQGTFNLPTAPDLSFANTNVSVPLSIPGSQYQVANLNGVSYLTDIQARDNGTFSFGTANPNNQNSIVLEVEYTTAQWDASSSPPSFFSLAGLEYYWWATLIAIMSFVGLGSVALSHFGADEEGLRIPKGKFGR